jgi:glycosyltransferase involved in cell wall biosynthesis
VTPRIVQFVADLMPRDAIGGHVLQIDALLREHGVDTEIYSGNAHPSLAHRARRYDEFGARSTSVPTYLLFHSSIGSPVAEFVAARPESLLVDYHNITPPEYFAGWEPHIAVELTVGRDQLSGLGARSLLGLADSSFNAGELVGLGFGAVAVVPILLDVGRLAGSDGVRGVAWPGGEGARWLFVGRVAPNKAQHDVVKAFAWYRRVFDAGASLTLAGGVSAGSYWVALQRFVERLGLSGAVRLAGSVSDEELHGLYRSADVFVCLSEHEGFCVPLLEAMAHGLPVVAFGAAAVPETLGDAGVLLGAKRPALVAEAVARVVGDAGVRDALVAAGRRRLELFDLPVSRRRLLDALAPILQGDTT